MAQTRSGLEALRRRRRELERAAESASAAPAWLPAFRSSDVTVVAEIKRRSPSAGDIATGLDPASFAGSYVAGGARAISVLTERPHFGGSLDDLAAVRRAVTVPLLRKDFILDPVQVIESRAAGASAILLITRALSAPVLRELARLARDLGLAILVEVHRREELDLALDVAPDAVGINSRDLETFQVDLAAAETLLPAIPGDLVAVAESGLSSRGDVERVAAWGADAVLVGTALARSGAPESAVRALTGVARTGRS